MSGLGARGRITIPLAAIGIFAVAYALASAYVTDQYYQLMLTLVLIWAVMGSSWNLLSGYAGLISFGHAAFFGLGAYTVTLLLTQFDVSPWFGIPGGALVGAVAAMVIGYPTFRLRGHYFALAMLAYPLALLYVFEWLGYQEIALPMKRVDPARYMQFSDNHVYTMLALSLLVAALLISLAVERSRFGMSLLAIKQNEPAAEAAGIDTLRWKMRALVLSGAVAALAGGLYAVVLLVITPQTVFGMLTSAQALVVTLVGGVGTMWGPVIGAAILVPLSETLQARLGNVVPGIQGVVYGVAIILVILLAPEGVFWRIRDRLAARKRPGAREPAPAPMRPIGEVAVSAHAAADRAPILEVSDLSRSFGGLQAVEGVSFAVRRGAILGIIGPNGAGKTTLFNLLNGFLPPDRGRVVCEGRDLIGLKPNQICRLGVGRTFQVVRSFSRMSVLQNVVVGALAAARSDSEAVEMARVALARVGLTDRASATAGTLSNQGLRLMELARAVAARPKLLLLDETLAGLGRQEVEEMIATIRSLAADGTTIVIIEHTMHAMVRLAEELLVLDHGRRLTVGSPAEVTRDPVVIEAYLGRKWVTAGVAG
ncbi:MAG TPA: branched-chain amino acid ABC transporter ATP-binding protein/permease [Burkholderiales bacterium]|nr:branched-chain amino acid ABC transporter ATP-binding protein/permease [Burkholderiales bacterium]